MKKHLTPAEYNRMMEDMRLTAEIKKLEREIELIEADKLLQEYRKKVREETKSYPKPWVRKKTETE